MKSFEPGVLERQRFPASLLGTARRLGEYRERLVLDLGRHPAPGRVPGPPAVGARPLEPARLKGSGPNGGARRDGLRRAASLASVESGMRLDGIVLPSGRVSEIAGGTVEPENRDEQLLAGYRDALASIADEAQAGSFTPRAVLRLHERLFRFTPGGGGSWTLSDDLVTETLPDGSSSVVFTPVPAYAVEDAMARLHDGFCARWDEEAIDRLLLIPAYLLDFLCIHPFSEGTDAIARLVGRLLLARAGYPIGEFVPLEVLFEQTLSARSAALKASWRGWHDASHDLAPWAGYLLGVVLDACTTLEGEMDRLAPPRGAKRDRVAEAIAQLPAEFRYADLLRLVPSISRPTINRALRRLREEHVVRCTRPGRNARWARSPQIHSDGSTDSRR